MADPPTTNNDEQAPLLLNDEQASGSTTPSHSSSNSGRAYAILFASSILISIRATIIHSVLSQTNIPLFVPIFLNSTLFLILSTCGTVVFSLDLQIRRTMQDRKSLLMIGSRTLMASIIIISSYFTLQTLDVGIGLTLFSTSPVIGFILSFLLLNDRITFTDCVILIINFVGVYFVIRQICNSSIVGVLGVLSALLCATLMATSLTLVKAMGTRISVIQHLFSIGVAGFVVALLLGVWDFHYFEALYYYAGYMPVILFAESITYLAQILNVYAIKLCRPGTALVVRSANVPVSFALGYFFLNEQPNMIEVIGVILVLTSISYIGLTQAQAR